MIRFARLSHRLGAGFATLLGVFMVTGALTSLQLWRIDQARSDIERSREHSVALAQWMDLVNGNLQRAVLATRLDQSVGDDTAMAQDLAPLVSQLNQDMADAASAAAEIQKHMVDATSDPALVALVERISAERNAFVGLRGQIKDDLLLGEGAERIDKELLPRAAAMQHAMQDLRTQLQDQSVAGAKRLQDSVRQVQWTLMVTGTLALLSGVALAVLMGRSITRPLDDAVAFARGIAQGDLTRSLSTTRPDEIGDLLRALGAMQQSLLQVMQQVRGASAGVDTAAHEIALGNQDLSDRTERAASSLQQTAASVEQLNSGMQNAAEAARTASDLAVENADLAARGGQVVGQVVATMEDIRHSSQKIHDIIGVIDGIAFQTNILALNAAVEAARAGEQGRGFAVVAGEVRNLAQRSAEAAREIKDLIGNSVNKVEAGTHLVSEAGSTISEVVANAQRVADMIGEITAASGEQSGGVAQIHTAVSQLDQMTQQNAALVEESTAAAQGLRDRAHQLDSLVKTFRLI